MNIAKVLENWKKNISHDPSQQQKVSRLGIDFLHEIWTPRWKCFNPPMWRIFRWAFDIRRTLYTNCYPIAVNNNIKPE